MKELKGLNKQPKSEYGGTVDEAMQELESKCEERVFAKVKENFDLKMEISRLSLHNLEQSERIEFLEKKNNKVLPDPFEFIEKTRTAISDNIKVYINDDYCNGFKITGILTASIDIFDIFKECNPV